MCSSDLEKKAHGWRALFGIRKKHEEESAHEEPAKEEKPEKIYADKKWLARLYAERIIGQKYTSLEIWHLARMIAYADGVDQD